MCRFFALDHVQGAMWAHAVRDDAKRERKKRKRARISCPITHTLLYFSPSYNACLQDQEHRPFLFSGSTSDWLLSLLGWPGCCFAITTTFTTVGCPNPEPSSPKNPNRIWPPVTRAAIITDSSIKHSGLVKNWESHLWLHHRSLHNNTSILHTTILSCACAIKSFWRAPWLYNYSATHYILVAKYSSSLIIDFSFTLVLHLVCHVILSHNHHHASILVPASATI